MRICTVTGNKEKGVKIMPRPYLGDPKYTIEVLQKYNFAFQKRFGQNFLIDTHVLDKIIDSAQITKDVYLDTFGALVSTCIWTVLSWFASGISLLVHKVNEMYE